MWVEKLARLGYAAKGVVYGLVGILAVMAAFNTGGKTTDTNGVLHTIAAQPFGSFLLTLVAIGLIGYVLWRFVQAITDPDHKGSDGQGIAIRIGYAFSGLIYASLATEAILLVTDSSKSGGGKSTQDWTALVLQQPFGRWLVAVGGALLMGIGFYRIYRAYRIKFRRKLDLTELNSNQENWAIRISRTGITARGIVFVLLGFFLIQASVQYDSDQARGLDGILETIAQQPFGKILLAIMAIGLIAYGIYMWIQARYRRIKTG